MGDGHDRKVSEADAQDTLQPVSIPLPKPRQPKPGVKVDPTHAPSVDQILDPKQPSMDDADSGVVVDAITDLVAKIYGGVLMPRLEQLKPQLAAVPPPPHDDQFGLQLIGWMVEAIATATVGVVGGIAARGLLGDSSRLAKVAGDEVKDVSKTAGKQAGGWTQDRLRPEAPERADPAAHEVYAAPGTPLIDEFIERQRLALLGKQQAAEDTLRLVRSSAARIKPTELAQLDSQLTQVLSRPDLSGWFSEKVTLEWLNFMARLSLGPRPDGQATNMAGANTIGGWHEAGQQAIVQWRGTHDGFVDVTIGVDGSTSVMFLGASVSGRPGAASILRSLADQVDASGASYNLATMPLFRRVWIKTGESAFMTNPAFVITPEGALEVNYDDPALAMLGGARLDSDAGPTDPFEGNRRRDPQLWADRATRASQAMAGAHRVVAVLSAQTPSRLQ